MVKVTFNNGALSVQKVGETCFTRFFIGGESKSTENERRCSKPEPVKRCYGVMYACM